MNTKGSSIMVMIFEIIVVLMISYIAVSMGQAFAESETTAKITAATDIQLMVNTLVAVPGDALVQYPINVSAFTFILDNNGIVVFQKGEPEVKWQTRPFFLPEGFTAEGTLDQKSNLCLEKKSKKILLRECDEP